MKLQNSVRISALAAALLGTSALATPVLAQDAAPQANEADGGEIIVTARLRNERLQDVPVAITALPAKQLDQYQVTSVTDMATFVPSMVVGRQVTGSSASIFLRGVGSTSLSAGFDQSVSFNIDGLAMSRGREISFTQYDLAQIEVLKGPQALYFGRNTTGGLISITTKGPTDHFEAGAKAGYGFEGKDRYVEGFVSGPLGEGLGARAAFRYAKSEGSLINTAPLTNADPTTGFLRRRVDDHRGGREVISGRLTLKWDAGDNFDATIKAGYTDYKDNGAGDLYERICGDGRTTPKPIGATVDPVADCKIDGRADHSTAPTEVLKGYRWARDGKPYTDLRSGSILGNLHWKVGQFDVTSITAYYKFSQQDLNDFTGSYRTNSVSQNAVYDQFSQELRLQSALDGPINGSLGAFYAKSNFKFDTDVYIQPFAFDPVAGNYLTFSRDDAFSAKTFSVFGELRWKLMENLELAGGARYSKDTRDSFQQARPGAVTGQGSFPPNKRIEDHFSDDNVSPQVTLTYKPSQDVSVYGAYKQGYKSGGYNISQTLTAGASRALGQFKSEGAKGWEIGTHAVLLDRALRINAAIYDYKYTDLQVQFYDPVLASQTVSNAGQLRTKGAEMDFNLAVPGAEGVSLRGAVAYNEAKFHKYLGQCYAGQSAAAGCNLLPNAAGTLFNAQNYEGRTAPKAPKWGVQMGFSYERSLSDAFKLQLTGDLNHTSSYNYTDALRPDAIQKAVTRLNASISVGADDDRWKLSLIGRNLTNRRVVTTANDMSFTGGTGTGSNTNPPAPAVLSDLNGIIDNPREIYVEASFKF